MYLFNLNMSNIKSEALAQECSKKGILKNSVELTEKQLCAGVSFIMKVQASWINETFRFTFYPAPMFSSEISEIFKNTFENSKSSVEHLPSSKVLFVKC